VFVSAIALLPLVWRGCEATAREQIYLLLLSGPARAGGEKHFLKTRRSDTSIFCFHRFRSLVSKNSSKITASGGSAVKKQKTKNSGDCLEIIQKEARSSKGRRDRIFAAGYAKGFEEGKESGCALGLAEELEKGKESAACAELATLK
jgi:hypothetical protein